MLFECCAHFLTCDNEFIRFFGRHIGGYEEVSFDWLYRKADKAMYQSKKQKGCSAVIYGEGM